MIRISSLQALLFSWLAYSAKATLGAAMKRPRPVHTQATIEEQLSHRVSARTQFTIRLLIRRDMQTSSQS